MIRVLVVDDHPVVRDGLVAVLGDESELEVVGAAGTAEEALALAARLRPDVVLLDLELPGMSGVEAIPRFAAASPSSRVLVFTAYDTGERVVGAVRAGARGYLLKGATVPEIVRALQVVHGGEVYLEPRVAARLVAEVNAPRQPAGLLSERERAVVRLVAAGQSNKQIARALKISERTVKFHVNSILNKLGAENRAHAAALAVERELL